MKIKILVVLYNKEISDSSTLKCLIEQRYDESFTIELVVFNNGPALLEKTKCNFLIKLKEVYASVLVKESLSNLSLSKIYNEELSTDFDYNFIFDDDSIFDCYHIHKSVIEGTDLVLPIINSQVDGKVYYPKLDDKILHQEQKFTSYEKIFSIGSGLCISNRIISYYNNGKIRLFNESYALYGVDFSFFRLLNDTKENKFLVSVSGKINHSLSKVEPVQSKFRIQERFISDLLNEIHYPENRKKSLVNILRLGSKCVVKLELKMLKIFFYVLLNKKHPRAE